MEMKVSRIVQCLVIYSFVSFINGQTTTESTIRTSGVTTSVFATSVMNSTTTSNDSTTRTLTTETLTTTTVVQTTTPIHVSAPQNLSNIEIPFNTSQLYLTWYQPGSADNFLVYVNNGSTHWSDVTLISQPPYANKSINATVNNLRVPGGQYKISVQAQYQNVSSNHSEVQTFYTYPANPVPIDFVSRTINSISFNWVQFGLVNSFEVSVDDRDRFNVTVVNPSSIDSLNPPSNGTRVRADSNLSIPGALYSFSVTARVQALQSQLQTFQNRTAPAQPSNLALLSHNTSSICFHWNQTGVVDKFNVYQDGEIVADPSVDPPERYNRTAEPWGVVACVYNCTPGMLYNFSVESQVDNLVSKSDFFSYRTVPERPGELKVSSQNTSSICITWNQTGNVDYFNITVKDHETYIVMANNSGTFRTCIVDLPIPGGSYTIVVTAHAGELTGENRKITAWTVPERPGEFKVSSQNTSSICITWNQTGNVDKFNITVKDHETYIVMVNNSGTFRTCIVDLPIPGGSYTIVVTAQAGELTSEKSSITAWTVPERPGELKVSYQNTSSICIMWNQTGNVDHFNITVNNQKADTTLLNVSETFEACLVNLIPGGSYTIVVIAHAGRAGELTSENGTITAWTVPSEPGAVNSTGQRTTNSMCFKWNQLGNYDKINIFLVVNNSANMHVNVTPPSSVELNTTVTACVYNLSIPGGSYQFQISAQISPLNQPNLNSAIQYYTDQTMPAEPGAVSFYSRNTSVLCFRWNQLGNYYKINILDANNSPYSNVNVMPPNETNNSVDLNTSVEACVSDLPIPGGLYQFLITAQISPSNQLNLISAIQNYTDQTTPATPSQFSCNYRTSNMFCFNWTQSGNYQNVTLYIVNDTNNNFESSYEPASASSDIIKLNTPVQACLQNLSVAGGLYEVVITVEINDYGNPPKVIKSDNASYANRTEPPPPGSVQCINTTTNSIGIIINPPNWNSSLYELDSYVYNVQSEITNYFPSNYTNTTSATVGVNSNAVILSLVPGVSYNITVQSVIDGIKSEVNDTTCHTYLSFPKDVNVGNAQNSSFQVDWTQPIGYYEGFSISCFDPSNNNVRSKYASYDTSGNATYEESCTGLTAGALYNVTVASILNDTSITPSATSNVSKVVTVPNSAVLSCSTSSSSSISMLMTLPGGQCTSYNISSDGSSRNCPCSGLNTSYVFSGLQSDSLNVINVTTVSAYGQNLMKSSQPAQCKNWTVSEQVTELSASPLNTDSVNLTWMPPTHNSNINSYIITVSTISGSCIQMIPLICIQNPPTNSSNNGNSCPSGSSENVSCLSTSMSHIISKLDPNTNYSFIVYAINPGGKSLDSPIFAATKATTSNPSYGWIAAVVIGAVLIIVLVVLLWRYKDRWQKLLAKKRPSSSERNESVLISPIPDETPPPAVPLRDFSEYVVNCHKDSDYLFSKQYMMLGNVSAKHTHTIPEMPQNRVKNRYVDILPFDHSRVKLMPTDINENEEDGYINANYIPGYNSVREFIAAQGPMRSTVDHFWQMIWEQNITVIVMVTNLIEKGREKCAQYWPSDNESVVYGEVQVQMKSETTNNYYVQRDFIVSFGSTVRYVTQYHFLTWPDFGVPDPEELLGFIKMIRDHVNRKVRSEKTGGGPVLIHCSAGVGRTGTFILLDHLLQVVQQDTFVDVFQIVKQMRNFRPRMVQTESQYSFAHDCLKLALEKEEQNRYNGDAVYVNHAMEPVYENTSTFVV